MISVLSATWIYIATSPHIVYDATRTRLLRGRHTLLRLCAAHLRAMQAEQPGRGLVWVDIGGGTGFNIEEMDKYFPIKEFERVYLIDLCEPLLSVARKRFAARGWTNVHVLCQDATFFSLPEWESGGVSARGTVSYSLSMIPSYFALLDRIDDLYVPLLLLRGRLMLTHLPVFVCILAMRARTSLDPAGLLGVADFYTSSRASTPLERAIGNGNERRTGFWSRWFWQIWFDLDHVSLSSARREYLEYRFGTPYYVFLGCSRSRSTTRAFKAFEIEAGNRQGSGHISPAHSPLFGAHAPAPGSPASVSSTSTVMDMPELELGPAALAGRGGRESLAFPLSSFHYQNRHWRLPFLEQKVHSEFRTWIYGFTWEDPEVDMQHLNLTKDDALFVITSAGDNALHYAISANPRRIHCVDMNPCQGHLLELKLAAATALSYDEFWAMFGEGKIANFEELLDTKLSPYMSSVAYQFWRANASAFRVGFHTRGYSGLALRLIRYALLCGGVRGWVRAMLDAETLEEQGRIWDKHLKPVILSPWVTSLFFSNPVFLWNALGVPINQMKCFLNEGFSAAKYAEQTLDPIAHNTHMRAGAYHYLLALKGYYTKESCPLFLTPSGFETLRADNGRVMDSFRLHTDSILNSLMGLADGSITKMVVMDHMDWFDPEAEDGSELDVEIAQMHRVLSKGGAVFWRSAAKKPWYIASFAKQGFQVEALAIRQPGNELIDRVNMYASFYRATKV
ncbi:hypothetical protein EIP86_009987 [Pleurotus ostreatoroseus]|nr:hypothetical protein EIP86_009987 [Pleurotus ostreatoroseus]